MTYKTSNIALATTLILKGNPLIDIEVQASRMNMVEFVFDDVSQEFLNKFDMGGFAVEPQTFHSKVRSLAGLAQRRCRDFK